MHFKIIELIWNVNFRKKISVYLILVPLTVQKMEYFYRNKLFKFDKFQADAECIEINFINDSVLWFMV